VTWTPPVFDPAPVVNRRVEDRSIVLLLCRAGPCSGLPSTVWCPVYRISNNGSIECWPFTWKTKVEIIIEKEKFVKLALSYSLVVALGCPLMAFSQEVRSNATSTETTTPAYTQSRGLLAHVSFVPRLTPTSVSTSADWDSDHNTDLPPAGRGSGQLPPMAKRQLPPMAKSAFATKRRLAFLLPGLAALGAGIYVRTHGYNPGSYKRYVACGPGYSPGSSCYFTEGNPLPTANKIGATMIFGGGAAIVIGLLWP